MNVELEHVDITRDVIGAAIEVHKALGPGFIESIYESALVWELAQRGIPYLRQHEVEVAYRGILVGVHRLDLLVAGVVVVELKAVAELRPEHFAIVRSYLRAMGLTTGLLMNFGGVTREARRVRPRS